MRIIVLLIAASYLLNGLYMLAAPHHWYDAIPGVSALGPYNTHFIRDVAIVYLVCAGGFFWGLGAGRAPALLVAAAWPALHAVYHVQMWAARGLPFDLVALTNVSLIQAPAWLGLYAAWRLYRDEAA